MRICLQKDVYLSKQHIKTCFGGVNCPRIQKKFNKKFFRKENCCRNVENWILDWKNESLRKLIIDIFALSPSLQQSNFSQGSIVKETKTLDQFYTSPHFLHTFAHFQIFLRASNLLLYINWNFDIRFYNTLIAVQISYH